MAKDGSKAMGWLKVAITAALIIIGGVSAFVWTQADVKAVDTKADNIKEDLGTIKKEGCDPSGDNTLNVALMQKDISTIQSTQSTIQADVRGLRAEQQAGFKEILKRLPK